MTTTYLQIYNQIEIPPVAAPDFPPTRLSQF